LTCSVLLDAETFDAHCLLFNSP